MLADHGIRNSENLAYFYSDVFHQFMNTHLLYKSYWAIIIFFLAGVFLAGCDNAGSSAENQKISPSQEVLHSLNDQATEAILQDGFSPPVGARVYAYSNLAAFEAIALFDERFQSLSGQINEFNHSVKLEEGMDYDPVRVLVEAYCETAKGLVYRDYLIDLGKENVYGMVEQLDTNSEIHQNSVKLGREIAGAVLNWSASDMYKETRSYPIFEPGKEEGDWQPTPPTYSNAIEPYWGEIRTMVLDSAAQFPPAPPAEFNKNKGSEFHQLAVEVIDAVSKTGEKEEAIARHWDCNPFVSINKGHLMYGKRQLTPGGHWMGIARTGMRLQGVDMAEATEVYCLTSIALFDAFISCWDEKYKTNVIRPETYINRYIEKGWRPLLETPMFPEHTSGHSVISNAAATILTNKVGPEVAFTDSVNTPYGLPPRDFSSFFNASEEAAISRLYGGIHYMPAITNGIEQGRKVGGFVLENLSTRK